ncbi:MAG: hypothetical protein U0R27_02200 [Candidatus Nanopelagicales bacterium]
MRQQKLLLYVFPIAVRGRWHRLPLEVLIYWLTTNLAGQPAGPG